MPRAGSPGPVRREPASFSLPPFCCRPWLSLSVRQKKTALFPARSGLGGFLQHQPSLSMWLGALHRWLLHPLHSCLLCIPSRRAHLNPPPSSRLSQHFQFWCVACSPFSGAVIDHHNIPGERQLGAWAHRECFCILVAPERGTSSPSQSLHWPSANCVGLQPARRVLWPRRWQSLAVLGNPWTGRHCGWLVAAGRVFLQLCFVSTRVRKM